MYGVYQRVPGLRCAKITMPRATAVEKLRDAKAVILSKSLTTEFACFDPPPTKNP